jgi:hypothetical protein
MQVLLVQRLDKASEVFLNNRGLLNSQCKQISQHLVSLLEAHQAMKANHTVSTDQNLQLRLLHSKVLLYLTKPQQRWMSGGQISTRWVDIRPKQVALTLQRRLDSRISNQEVLVQSPENQRPSLKPVPHTVHHLPDSRTPE